MTSAPLANAPARDRPQFSLAAAIVLMTVCAIYAWLTRLVGFIPVVAATYGITLGASVGSIIGLPSRAPWGGAAAGASGALVAISCAAAWWLWIVSNKMQALGLNFPVNVPIAYLFDVHVVLYGTVIVLVGAVPVAAIAAVHDRRGEQVLARATFTCAISTFVTGSAYLAFVAWSGGLRGMPGHPVFAVIPLFIGTVAAAFIGLVTGLIWLGIRSLLQALRRPART